MTPRCRKQPETQLLVTVSSLGSGHNDRCVYTTPDVLPVIFPN